MLRKRIPLRVMAVLSLAILAGLLVACCCAGGMDDEDIELNLNQSDPLPPVAAVSADPSDVADSLEVAFDASASYDSDGTIVQYDWDWQNDGTWDLLDGGATPSHTYDDGGEYTVTVRVTDNDGLTDTASATPFTIPAVVSPPEAQGTAAQDTENPLTANLDASDSFDTDGEIVQYDWDMDNDGVFEIIDGGPNPSHTFDGYGEFTVNVRVTDDDGLQDTAQITGMLSAPPADEPPVADLVANPAAGNAPELEVTWDASGSSDSDGSIVRYDWDMDNDGTYEINDGGDTQVVTYDTGGLMTVGVQVTDDDGLTDSTTADCDVNEPPVADLTATPETFEVPEDVTFDASGSTDSDGTIEQYDWDMDNDGTYEITDGGDSQVLAITSSGTHTVGVQVTDDDGATHNTTVDVTGSDPPANQPPTAVINADPTWGMYPLYTDIDGLGSSDPDGSIVDYEWDFDGDGVFNETGDEANARGSAGPHNIRYDMGGTYTAALRVTDDGTPAESDTATTDIEVYTDNDTFSITVNLTIRDISSFTSTSDSLVRLYHGDPNAGGTPVDQIPVSHDITSGLGTALFEDVAQGTDYYVRVLNIIVHWDGDVDPPPLATKDLGPYVLPPDQVIDLTGFQYQNPPVPGG